MTRIFKIGGAALLGASLICLVGQRSAITKLRRENAALRQLPAAVSSEARQSEAASSPGADPQLVSEINRLRNEVATLRRENAELRRLSKQAAQARPGAMAAPEPIPDAETRKREEFKQEMIAQLNYARQAMLAFHLFAEKNNGTIPAQFADAAPYLPDDLKTHPSAELYEIVYSGKLADIAEPQKTIILRQKEAVVSPDGKYLKGYGFADGHSEIHAEGEKSFAEWEKSRLAPVVTP